MTDRIQRDDTEFPTTGGRATGDASYSSDQTPLRRTTPLRRGALPTPPIDPVRDPLRSTTAEDIERADGEGMCPVPPPRPHVRG